MIAGSQIAVIDVELRPFDAGLDGLLEIARGSPPGKTDFVQERKALNVGSQISEFRTHEHTICEDSER